jgi:ABC-type lipoprotein release transport system permease subunit
MRLRSWLALAVLAGLVGGGAIATAAAARRTETAVPRSIAESNFSDGTVQQFGAPTLDFRAVRQLPQVAYAYRAENLLFTGETDAGRPLDVGKAGLVASPDPTVGVSREAPKIVRGRQADPAAVHEAVADEEAAELLGLAVGDTFTARFGAPDQVGEFFADTGDTTKLATEGPEVTFTVVGVSAVIPSALANYPEVQLTSAFYREFADEAASFPRLGVYLVHDADRDEFEREVEGLAGGEPAGVRGGPELFDQVQRGVHIQSGALWVLAALAAIVALLLVGQGLARQAFEDSGDYPTLRAIGMTRRQLVALALVRAAAIGVLGALVAITLTVALSPLSPVGSLTRKAEPDPGVSFDALVILAGATVLFLFVVAAAALAAWRAIRQIGEPAKARSRVSPIADRLARAGASPTAVTGTRMALEPGHGSTAVPTRTTIAGAAIAIAAIATALTFIASLNRLVDTPALYGQTWDVQMGDGVSPDIAAKAYPALRHDEFVGAFSGGTLDEADVDGHRVGVLALEPIRGMIGPALVDGRAPRADDEVLLDPGTLDEIGAATGDEVEVAVGTRSARMEVVGSGVLTDIEGAEPLLGNGAMLTFDGYERLAPDAARNFFFARFEPGVDEREAIESMTRFDPITGAEPVDVTNYGRIQAVPIVIGALLVLIAIATLFHTLVSSIRRRRRDLAILKVVGFERTQVSRVVAWQATTIVAVAAFIGVPLGIAAGRWGWTIFAEELGVVPDSVVPLVPILVLLPAALIVANLIAAPPAAIAARTPAAEVLRTE